MNESCVFGSHHPSLTLATILFLMKGCQEEIHPIPLNALFDLLFENSFDHLLVNVSICNLVHLLVCSLIAQIQSNDSPKTVFLLMLSSRS